MLVPFDDIGDPKRIERFQISRDSAPLFKIEGHPEFIENIEGILNGIGLGFIFLRRVFHSGRFQAVKGPFITHDHQLFWVRSNNIGSAIGLKPRSDHIRHPPST